MRMSRKTIRLHVGIRLHIDIGSFHPDSSAFRASHLKVSFSVCVLEKLTSVPIRCLAID